MDTMAENGAARAGDLHAPHLAADALRLAMVDFRADRLDRSAAHAREVLAFDSAAIRADAFILLARIARRQGRLDAALEKCSRAIESALAAADLARECRAHVQYAHALNALGLIEPALEESYCARRLAEESGDPAAEAAAAEALAGVQWAMSQWPEALESFERMLALATRAGDIELQAIACGGLAGAVGHMAQLPSATDPAAARQRAHAHVLEYERLATLLGDVHAVRSARHNRAIALIALDDGPGARKLLQQVLAETDEGEARALGLINLADLDRQEGHAAVAVQQLKAAHVLLTAVPDTSYLLPCCRALCDAEEALGNATAALAWHRQFHEHYVRLSSERAQMHARALEVKYETGRAQAVAEYERVRAQRFERDALEDGLTGIGNRRAFDAMLAEAIAGAAQGRPFSLAMIDLDHFKQVNDAHSHLVGDEVLRRIAGILVAKSRRGDAAARYGGEEFAMVLAHVDATTARMACERIRAAVECEDWTGVAAGLVVRLSIGCVHVTAAEATVGAKALLARADRRLYAAKAAGRNRVVADDEPAPDVPA